MKKVMQLSGVISLAVFSNHMVFAEDDLSLDALLNVKVHSAGFFADSADKSTGHAYVYDRNFLNRYNLKSMDELLEKYVPAMSIGTHKMTGGKVLTRGLDTPSRLLFLADGDNVNRRTGYGKMYTELANPLMGDIENVEVILGPGALVHGTGALNGFVNTISPTGLSRPGVWSKLSNPNVGQHTGEVSYGTSFGTDRKQSLFVYAGFAEAEGVSPTRNYNTGVMGTAAGSKNAEGTPDIATTDLPATTTGGVAGTYRADFRNTQKVNYMPETNWKTLLRYINGSDSDFWKLDTKLRIERTARDTGAPTWARARGSAADAAKDDTVTTGNGPCYVSWAPTCLYNLMNQKDKVETNSGYNYSENTSLTLNPNLALNLGSAQNVEVSPYFHIYQTVLKPFEWAKNEFLKSGRSISEMQIAGNAEQQVGAKVIYRNKMITNNGLAVGIDASEKLFSGEKPFFFSGKWTTTTELANSFNWKEYALFAEDVYTMNDLTLSAGVRYDKANFGEVAIDDNFSNKTSNYSAVIHEKFTKKPTNVSSPTYRLASAYKINDAQNIKFSYQTGFRFPDAGNYRWLYLKNKAADNAGLSQLKYPDLKAETSQTVEVNYVHKLKQYNLAFDFTAYYSIYKNMLNWIQANTDANDGTEISNRWHNYVKAGSKEGNFNGWWGTIVNSEKTFKAAGVEAGMIYRKSNVDASLWYSASKPIGEGANSIGLSTQDKKRWSSVAEHTIKGTGAYDFGDYVLSGIAWWNSGINFDPNKNNIGANKQHMDRNLFRLDLNGIYQVSKTVSLSAFVNNITDNKMGRSTPSYDAYDILVGGQQIGRTFGTSLVASF